MKQFVKENIEAKKSIVIIISAELSSLQESVNKPRTKLLEDLLKVNSIPYKKSIGCYKGCTENSFVCAPKTLKQIEQLGTFSKAFDQDSILFRTSTGGVYLCFNNGDKLRLGDKLVSVSESKAKSQDAYTFVDGRYYVVG